MSDRLKSRFTRPTTTSVRSAIIAPVGWYIGCCVCFRFLFYGWRLWCCMIEINHVRCLIDRHAELHVHRHVASPSVAKHCVSTPFFYKAERTYVRRQWDVGRGGAGNDVCLTATLASGLFMNSRSFVRSSVCLSVGLVPAACGNGNAFRHNSAWFGATDKKSCCCCCSCVELYYKASSIAPQRFSTAILNSLVDAFMHD